MKTKINSKELYIYGLIWILANVFSLYKLYTSQTEILVNNPHLANELRDLEPGWSFLSRLKDTSDTEWSSWKYFMKMSLFYLVLQFFVTEAIRNSAPSLLKYWHITSSMTFVILHMGFRQLLLIVTQPLLYATILFSGGRKRAIWVTSIMLLITYNTLKYKTFFWHFLDHDDLYDEEVYLMLICMPWIELRCISFCIDYIDRYKEISADQSNISSLVDMLSYILYLPLLYTGPVILYEDFEKSFSAPVEKLSVRLKIFLKNMTIFLFYTFILDLASHYFYFYAMQDSMELIKMLPPIALSGGGLYMGLQFHMKYVIAYGTSSAFAQLDNMVTPPTPRCVARIHVYSQMWRHFDVGLYNFLLKYIYKPRFRIASNYYNLPKTINKMIASLASFVFIFTWHGTTIHIFVWSLLNYLGITLEYISKAISETDIYHWFKKNVLKTEEMETRFIGVLCGPLLILSAVSNFYLFAGTNVGDWFFECLSQSSFSWNSICIYTSIYCCCVVSMALEDVPSRTDVKHKHAMAKSKQELSTPLCYMSEQGQSTETVRGVKPQ